MLGWRIGSRRLKFEHFQDQNFDNRKIWRNKHCYWWWNDWIVAWRSNSWILGQEIIWWPSERGHCGYTTSESDRLDEIQRAQEHTSEPACVFEIAFETLWFRLHSHSFIWPYDPSFDFNQLEKLEVVRNRVLRSIVGWAPLVDNDWHALMQKKWNMHCTMDWGIVGWKISFCSEDCICNEFLGLCYEWMISPPKVACELLFKTS